MTRHCLDSPEEINIINIYGPYNHKVIFWDRVIAEGTLDLLNLIIAGELNFTWSACEIWGVKLKMTCLVTTLWT